MMMRNKILRFLFFPLVLSSIFLIGAKGQQKDTPKHGEPTENLILQGIGPGYTINFNNVSILEYIKFISKVSGTNFIYNENELQFNVTILSEEPTSIINVMSALVQVLKINGFSLIEQGNNLIITRTGTGRQIATVVSSESPLKEGESIPMIMTRVFKVQNANPVKLGSILTPLLSPDAILEVSAESRHLIITDITHNIEEVHKLLLTLDAPKSPLEIDTYTTRNNQPEALIPLVNQLILPLSEGNPVILVPQASTNTIFVVSTPFLIEQTMMILEDLDNPPSLTRKFEGPLTGKNILLYHITNKPADVLQSAINKLANSLQQTGPSAQDLVESLNSMRFIRESHSLLFLGDPQTLSEVKTILQNLDVPYSKEELEYVTGGYYIYKIQNTTEEQISSSLQKFAQNLSKSPHPDTSLIKAIESMKWIKESNSLIFTGDKLALNQLQQILPTFDTVSRLATNNDFFVYSPRNQTGQDLLGQIQDVTKTLQSSGLADSAFINALNSAKWVSSSQSLIFTGDPESIDRIKALLAVMDQPGPQPEAATLFVYKIQSVSPDYLEKALQKVAKSVPAGDPIATTIDNMKYIEESNSLVFRGPSNVITRIKEIISTIDTKDGTSNLVFVYHPKNLSPEDFLNQMLDAAVDMEKSKLANPQLIQAIESAKLVSNKNAVMFTGTAGAIQDIKEMVTKFDREGPKTSEFFVYKPQYISAQTLAEHAKLVGENMESSGLADPHIINTLLNARVVSNGKAVLFTGTTDSITKVKELLPSIDEVKEDDVKKIGKTTFLIYKIKNVQGPTLMGYLRNMGDDLKQAGTSDLDLIKTLSTMRYVKETNSIIFTGNPDALEKAKALAEKFDITALATEAPRTPSGYLIYKPKYVAGEHLIQILKEFEQNVVTSGVQDQGLSDAVNNLKWMASTQNILISGSDEDTKKVYDLLERFDVPGPGIPSDTGIEKLANMSFLVYKLQYHSGTEIQNAIRKIGDDLKKLEKAGKSDQDLIDAINSLQWIEVTNSLITTGQADALTKLRELIKSIDVPLKQVFVEILVVETTLSNSLSFGLRWGSQGKYRDKFAYSTSAYPQSTTTFPDALADFNSNLQSISATTTPTGTNFPASDGFDLGIIGDIILHKGQSYFALGSLVNAIRGDSDSTIALNQKIITQDNKNSVIFVGQNLPYTGSIITNTTGNNSSLTNANLEYRDIGVSLNITPQVGSNDTITLNINEEITEQIGQTTGTNTSTTTLNGISTSKTTTQTSVTVPNKSFLVLSGQIRNTTSRLRTSIPCLGGLPIIGAAFQQSDSLKENAAVLIFVRPHIINSFDEYKEVTAHQEDIHRREINDEEDFDVALELVKTPDDE